MNPADEIKLELTSDVRELPAIRDQFRAFVRALGWDEHDMADIVLAADEALTNVIRHGYGSQPGNHIQMYARRVVDPQRGAGIEIVIHDRARQVPLEKICGRDLDDVRPGGLGVHIIRSLMDESAYSHRDGGGMQLVMRKFHATGKGAT